MKYMTQQARRFVSYIRSSVPEISFAIRWMHAKKMPLLVGFFEACRVIHMDARHCYSSFFTLRQRKSEWCSVHFVLSLCSQKICRVIIKWQCLVAHSEPYPFSKRRRRTVLDDMWIPKLFKFEAIVSEVILLLSREPITERAIKRSVI